MPTLIDTYQPSLVLTETIATQGVFPSSETFASGMTLAMFHTYAFNFGLAHAPLANGQSLSLGQNTQLFAILTDIYGGDGLTNFAFPNLAGRAAVGMGEGPGLTSLALGEQTGAATTVLGQQQMPASLGGAQAALAEDQPELAIKYLIRAPQGVFQGSDFGMLGMIVKFAGNFVPLGYMECNGQLLDIAQNETLFSLIGTQFGGDGITNFALPDLRGRTAVGAGGEYALGETFGQQGVTIDQSHLPVEMGGGGQPLDNREPSLAVNFIIAIQGVFPSQGGAPLEQEPFLGEILAYAGSVAPKGFAFAHGQLLSINQNQALFSLLGTMYGGDGQTTFALPDLRDRAIVGQGNGLLPGQVLGSNVITLTLDHIPNLTNDGTDAAETLYGGNGDDVIDGRSGNDIIIAHGGHDTLHGGEGDDILVGGSGNDTLHGGPGMDTLIGGEGDDVLDGGVVSDPLTQGNFLFGGPGDDTYVVWNIFDLVHEFDHIPAFAPLGGGGHNTIISKAAWYWDVYGVGDTLIIDPDAAQSLDANENPIGTTIVGGTGDNRLVGNANTNYMFGGGGSDTYVPGGGTDYISLSLLGLAGAVRGSNTILMKQGDSYNIIFEFMPGTDKVDLVDFGLADFDALMAKGFNDSFGNSYFALGDGFDYLYMVGHELDKFSAADFVLA
jgi:microcystin-dependent protein